MAEIINQIINGGTVITKTEDEFLDKVKEVEANTSYIPAEIASLNFIGDGDTNVLELEENEKSNFFVNCNSGNELSLTCRPYSVKTFCDRLGISGPLLSKISNVKLAELLNFCKQEYPANEIIQVVKLGDNCCLAALSDGYKVLEADEVFVKAFTEIKKLGGKYSSGYIDADIFHASYILRNKQLQEIYAEKFEEFSNGTPMLDIETSNTGLSSVSIIPKFKFKDFELIVGKPLKVLHKGNSDMAAVDEAIGQIFPIFKSSIDGLTRLKKVRIENPLCCFKNIAKRVLLPKKYSMLAAENFETFLSDEVNAFDIYWGLTEVLFYAKNDERPQVFLNMLEEQVARALYLDYPKYDVPYSEWK